MGKNQQDQYLQQQQQTSIDGGDPSSGFVCEGCSFLSGVFSFKCLFIFFLSFSALLSGIFWILPTDSRNFGFDAKDVIKQSATVHASFRLEKPVSQLIPYIERLEYDIFGEIGLPNTKVAVLSMHQSVKPNLTDVVFGVLSDPINASINPVSLSLLKSSLIELFLQQSNLTLTSVFGNASMFEILKCPGGLTIVPEQSGSIWQIPEVLFNFTLNNSTSEVLNNIDDLKVELKSGLHLKPDEIVYVQITNAKGSTEAPPVIVQASVLPGFGSLLPQRLKQLAQVITGSSAKNLGLDNSVFGKVKEIRLSSYLEGTLHATAPSPSPSISPELAPSHPPISPPTFEKPPCFNCEVSSPEPSSTVTEHPPDPCPYSGFVYPPRLSPSSYSKSSFPPYHSPPAVAPFSHSANRNTEKASDLSPIAEVSHGSKLLQIEGRSKRLVSQSFAPSSTSSAGGDFHRGTLLLGVCMLLISFVLLNDITF